MPEPYACESVEIFLILVYQYKEVLRLFANLNFNLLFNLTLCVLILPTSCNVLEKSLPINKTNILIVSDEKCQMHRLEKNLCELSDYQFTQVLPENMDDDLSDYTHVIMYVHSTLDDVVESALINYAVAGGRLIVLHHGIASAKMKNKRWLPFLGVKLYPRDHGEYPWGVLADTLHTMVNLCPGHYITTNEINYEKTLKFETDYPRDFSGEFQAFDLQNTEIFLNQRVDSVDKVILFGVCNEKGDIMQASSGWIKNTGKGKVFYFQAGHNESDFDNANFLQVIRNTIEWK
jgi:hypothetical protein